jgi:hypothetical protein
MSKFVYYFSGLISGIYISQNYNIPNLNSSLNFILNQISYYEKQNKNSDTNK